MYQLFNFHTEKAINYKTYYNKPDAMKAKNDYLKYIAEKYNNYKPIIYLKKMPNQPQALQNKINSIMKESYDNTIAKDNSTAEYVTFLDRTIVGLDKLKERYKSGIKKMKT